MSVYPIALALVAVANIVILVRNYALPWWRRRRVYTDFCEVCNKQLTRNSVRELRSEAADDGTEGFEMGGTAMIATYCRRHFPK